MLRRDHQLRADLGRIYSFSLGLRMDEDGYHRRPDVMACRIYARQTLEDIARSQEDPFNYRLLDLWLDVFQRPWDQPTNLHQLLDDLAREVGKGELRIYLEHDPLEQEASHSKGPDKKENAAHGVDNSNSPETAFGQKEPRKPASRHKQAAADGDNTAAGRDRNSSKAGIEGKSSPLEDRKVAKQIKEDDEAVYGYSPKKGKGLDKFGIDFSDPDQVSAARSKRVDYLNDLESKRDSLKKEVERLKKEGMSMEDIARKKVEDRNRDRMASYEERGDQDGLEAMKERNLQEYGREQGPTADQLFEKKGSWEDVIFGSVKPNRAMNVLLGLD